MILAHFVGDRINLMRRSLGGDQTIELLNAKSVDNYKLKLENYFKFNYIR